MNYDCIRGNMIAIVSCLFVASLMGCGGGGSSTTATSGDTTGEGTASLESLSTLPTADLSTYDSSSSASANVAVLLNQSKAKGVVKGFGENLNKVGGSSRAGCESNMHKQEVIRMSQQIQLPRCFAEAMEKADLIEIPSGSFNAYHISFPEDDNSGEFCDGIPAERVDEKAACLAESAGPPDMRVRIGNIDSALQMDMCEDGALVEESTFSASGSNYSVTAIHSNTWGGKAEKSKFSATISGINSVTDGIVTLASTGSVVASSIMSGGFGKGTIGFEAIASDSSNRVYGGFAGSFTDPFTQKATTFTGKAYSRFGGASNVGTAKYSFSGSMPPMRIQDMIPPGLAGDQLEGFLEAFGAEIGISLTLENYQTTFLCPNPLFKPESPSNTVKPMVEMTGDACGDVEHTGIESFAISNGAITEGFGTKIVQAFTIISNTDSTYFDEVNAYDLSTLLATAADADLAFSRSWDCSSSSFNEINFGTFTQAQMQTVDSYMQKCFEKEEEARNNSGMGGYNCGEEQNQNDVNEFAENGPSFGNYGGDLSYTSGCVGAQGLPQKMFINATEPDEDEYCLPSEGGCEEFTVVAATDSADTADLPIEFGNSAGGLNITAMVFTQAGTDPASEVAITFAAPLSCTATYTMDQPSFQGPPEFKEGEGGFIPQACKNAGLTTESACHQLCGDPTVDCSE